jgi:hypothetical protein
VVVRVMYHDDKHDVVSDSLLQKLIEEKRVKKFYRPSEGWVTVGRNPVRGRGGAYHGPDRRVNLPDKSEQTTDDDSAS